MLFFYMNIFQLRKILNQLCNLSCIESNFKGLLNCEI